MMGHYIKIFGRNLSGFNQMKIRKIIGLVGLSLVSATALADGPYTVFDLGTIGGTISQGTSVNNDGTVAGFGRTSQFNRHAIRYSNGTTTDIGTLGGLDSWANGINSSGVIVGAAYPSSNISNRAFVYANGVMTDIGSLGGAWSEAFAINDLGQVTGTAEQLGSGSHAFLYSNGQMIDLDPVPSRASIGYAINKNAQVAGRTFSNSVYRAFFYSNGQFQILPTLGGTHGFATGINDAGIVVGYANATDGFNHPCMYTNGTVTDLGTLGGIAGGAIDINNLNQIVGSYTKNGVTHAFVHQNGSMQDLNTLVNASGTPWELTAATSISDSGFITGYGTINGQVHGFLLSPVPEPSTMVALGLGALGLSRIRRRKR